MVAADGMCDVMSQVELSVNQLVFHAADITASCLGNVQYTSARLFSLLSTAYRLRHQYTSCDVRVKGRCARAARAGARAQLSPRCVTPHVRCVRTTRAKNSSSHKHNKASQTRSSPPPEPRATPTPPPVQHSPRMRHVSSGNTDFTGEVRTDGAANRRPPP